MFPIILNSLARLSGKIRLDVSETVGEAVLASRMPSGTLLVDEMMYRNIYPFFCPEEEKMVWVENPGSTESCPWCFGPLFIFG